MAVVGLVGVGLLGHAVASRLLDAGHEVIGCDVVPERVAALTALGGKGVRSITEVTASAGMVCTLLPSLAAVEQAVLGPDGVLAGLRPDGVVVQMSTISPALTERLAREAAAKGRAFLDCPVSGTSGQVARGDGILMVGGDLALYERWRPVLESILPRSYHVGAAGQAMLLKLVANLLVALNSAAAAEALNLAGQGGLDPARALEVLTASAATSKMLEVRGPLMVRGEFPAQMKLELFMKDLHLIQDAARAAGAALPLTDVAERLYASAMDGGHAADDLSAVVRVLEGLRATGR
jgi:3-hydroxyisobutyrate dehydrogenase-like beta-hydroxyacid dehydrogenase